MGELPFDRDGGRALLMGVAAPNLPPKFSKGVNTLIQKCLNKDPELRPTARQLVLWANHYLENQVWDLTESNELTRVSNSTTTPSRGTVVNRSNPKFSDQDTPVSPSSKPNYVLWGGVGMAVVGGLLWFTWPKSTSQPTLQMATTTTDTTKIESQKQETDVVSLTNTPTPNSKPDRKQRPEVSPNSVNNSPPISPQTKIENALEEPNPNQAKIEELLALGERAINNENDKDGAIIPFSQAQALNNKGTKVATERFTKLYIIYEDKGDKIFEAEVYENAKKWYEVAKALNNTAEIRRKIESCESKMRN